MALVTALWCAPVPAHQLKVFAWAEGDTIRGYAYFSGGGRAAGARITIIGPHGATLATLRPDAEGEFSHTTTLRAPHRVVADTGDGHRASWTVTAAEPGAGADTPLRGAAAPPPAAHPETPPAADDRLAALVERAVARQVGPLRAELKAHAERARLADVVGGIGFIFGIAGVVLWWRSRRHRR